MPGCLQGRVRASLVTLVTAISLAISANVSLVRFSFGQDKSSVLTRESVLRDPEIPVMGNPKGDLTIVEYFDYQCPYCKSVAPVIQQVVKDDGKIRFVLKDWPIFGAVSTYAARLVLASKYQNKYAAAHRALIGAKGKLTVSRVDELLAAESVDLSKLRSDLQASQKIIDDLLARNNAQAEAFGFQGTPAFIIGTFRVPGVLNAAAFKQAVHDARKAASQR